MNSEKLKLTLKDRMKSQGHSTKSLALKSGLSYSTLRKYLNSHTEMSSDKLIILLKALDFDLNKELSKSIASDKAFSLSHHMQRSITRILGGL
jgi:transcriptional regulator with XRE-family HTH domain